MNKDESLYAKLSTLTHGELSNLKLSRTELLNLLSETITEKNKLEGVLQSIDNGVFAVDWDGKLILFNRAAEEITGLKQTEVIGHYCEELLQIVDKKGNAKSADAPLAEAFASGKVLEIPLYYLRSKKRKKKIPASATYTSVKGLKNALVLGICVFKDLRKEEELERMKADFVSMAAHELRTPLTSIRGYLSILNEELIGVDNEYKEFIKRALISATRLDTLVKNILSVAKIERGTIPLNFREFSPKMIIEMIISDLKERIAEKKIGLSLEIADEVKVVFGDQEKIREVLTNFVDNAVSYTPSGGRIWVSVSNKGKMVEFRVTDTGIGLKAEDRNRLFKKFSRVQHKATPEVKGTGLGLYISKLIIAMHKGKIGVESKGVGKGSSFYFLLPMHNFRLSQHQL